MNIIKPLFHEKLSILVSGGGCLESLLSLACADISPALHKIFLQLSLAPAGLELSTAQVDTHTGHLHSDQSEISIDDYQPIRAQCECGLMTRDDQCSMVSALEILHNKTLLKQTKKTVNTVPAVIDSYNHKKKAIVTALETAANLSNIGMIIKC